MTEHTEYSHIKVDDIAFIITKSDVKDIVQSRNGWVDVEWTDELVDKYMKDFTQALEWSAIDSVHEVVIDTAVNIEIEIGMDESE